LGALRFPTPFVVQERAMLRIIGGLRYDTSTATKIASFTKDYGLTYSTTSSETLYRTENGNWFLHKEGFIVDKEDLNKKGDIRPLSPSEAQAWLEKRDEIAALETYFGDQITDA
jgi:hypothetical protein